MLPERTPEAEDRYLKRWQDSDDTDGLIASITASVEAKRPQLAARLVGLLDEHVEVDPRSPVARARRAAKLLMLPQATPQHFAELQAAWLVARRLRMRRITRRMRPKKKDGGHRSSRSSRYRR